MTRRLTLRRPSLAETLRRNQAALDLLASCSDRPRIDLQAPAVRPARQPAQSPRPRIKRVEAAEKDVKTAVLTFLANHPAVATVILINGGTAYNESGAPVQFYRVVKGPKLMVDVMGELRDGRSYRIELKREGWKMAGPDAMHDGAIRERKQLECIQDCISRGGVGGFVTSVEQAQEIIECQPR